MDLLSLDYRFLNEWAQTGRGGRFSFKEVHPGRYRLGVNIDRPPTADARLGSRYAPSYYPGSADAERAAEIVVRPGETIQLFDQRLPAELPVRSIRGRVVRADGGSVAGSYVSLAVEGSQSYAGWGSVDGEAGEFRLQGLEGLSYVVSCRLSSGSGEEKWEAVAPDSDEVLLILEPVQ